MSFCNPDLGLKWKFKVPYAIWDLKILVIGRVFEIRSPRGGTFLGRNVPKKCSFLPRTFVPLRNICSSRDLHVIDKDQITALSVHVTSTTPDPGDNWP